MDHVQGVRPLARIESLLRRPPSYTGSPSTINTYSFGAIIVDFRSMEVSRKGKVIDISQRELQLLKHFIEHRNAPLSRETILNAVWGYDSMPTTRTIDTHITWLRQKLEDNPRHPKFFLTVHGVGYKFVG